MGLSAPELPFTACSTLCAAAAAAQIVNPGVGEGGQALEACLTPDGHYVMSGSPDRAIRAWSVANGQEVACWTSHAGVPACLKVGELSRAQPCSRCRCQPALGCSACRAAIRIALPAHSPTPPTHADGPTTLSLPLCAVFAAQDAGGVSLLRPELLDTRPG